MADETVSGGKETQDPQGRVGHLYSEGPNPYPGGQVDTGDTPLPPYDSIRSKVRTRARPPGPAPRAPSGCSRTR